MDALATVIEMLHLKPTVFHRLPLAIPWGITMNSASGAGFHVVLAGECYLRLNGQVTPLEVGDLVLVSNTSDYSIIDRPDGKALALPDLLARRVIGQAVGFNGVGEEAARLLCGDFYSERRTLYPLFAILPPLIHIPNQGGSPMHWLSAPLGMFDFEMAHNYPARDVIMRHVLDVLLVMILRYWIVHHAERGGGWLAALYHPQIGSVLAAIHNQPGTAWTVESLAAQANLSRSALAGKFTELVGEAPMTYLTRWRMQLAANALLNEPYTTIQEIGMRVGYASAYAFSKAFKRWVGMAPSAYRRSVE